MSHAAQPECDRCNDEPMLEKAHDELGNITMRTVRCPQCGRDGTGRENQRWRDRVELQRIELSGNGPARASGGHMSMPDIVKEHDGFSLLTPEQRTAWFQSIALTMTTAGCVVLRYSVDNDRLPRRGLVEGWLHRQDPHRMVPVQWPSVDRMPSEGVVSATEDLTAVVKPPDQEIRA